VRGYKKSVDRYHDPQTRVMTGNRGEDNPKLLIGRVETPRDVPIDGEEGISGIALANTEITTAAEGVADSSTGSSKGSDG
jgi:hypothetical protein